MVVADLEEEGTKPGLSARSKLLSREGPEEGLSQKLINQDFPGIHEFGPTAALLLSGRRLHAEPPVSRTPVEILGM